MDVMDTVGSSDLLLVVDIQNDFCPGGALDVPHGNEIIPIVNELSERFPHVVLTQDWHPPGHGSFASSHAGREPFEIVNVDYGEQILWPDHCVQGTFGAEFHSDLKVDHAELVMRKGFRPNIDSYSAFYENDSRTRTGLVGYLRDRGVGRIFLCGLATDFCVKWSALDARREGFEVVVFEDACRGIDVDGSLSVAREEMRAAGVTLATARVGATAGGPW